MSSTARAGRDANLLAALSLAVADRVSDSAARAADGSVSDAAALCYLDQFSDGVAVDRLRRVVGLTPSGAVRLVDRLEAARAIQRRPGPDGRTLAVSLTARGRRAARRVTAARALVAESVLTDLTPADRRRLERLLAQVIGSVVRQAAISRPQDLGFMCRLCDARACRRDQGECPAQRTAAEAFGKDTSGR